MVLWGCLFFYWLFVIQERGKEVSVILLGEVFSETQEVEIKCEACKEPVARVTPEELAWLSVHNERVFCFDCDSFYADLIPPQLMPTFRTNVLIYREDRMAATELRIDEEGPGGVYCIRRGGYRLSSCPYLSQGEKKTLEKEQGYTR